MPTERARRLHVALPVLFLLLIPTLLLWRVVFMGDVFLPADLLRDIAPWRDPARLVPWNPLMWDGMAEFYPWRLFYSRTLHQGFLPLWNPYQFCGTPFAANSQSAIFYPLNALFALLPVAKAFGVSVWLHLTLTGLLMYGFLRSGAVGVSRPAALVGSVAWQLSTWQTGWLALPTFLCVSCWLPLTLWLTFRLAQRPGAGRAAALGAVLGLTVLAGHLQIALYGFGLTAAYALFLGWKRVREGGVGVWMLLGYAALALIFMAGIAAPQILPTLELSRVSHRAGGSLSWGNYEGYVRLAVPGINLLTLYLPGVFGNPTDGTYWGVGTNGGPGAYVENGCYVGVLALLLAVLGIGVTWKASASTRFLTGAALAALLLALGTPLNALLYFGIPGFAQSGSPGRILVVWTFCAAALAAIGTDALLVASRRTLILTASAFGAGVLLLGAGAVLWVARNAPAGTLQANLAHETDLWRLPLGILLGAALCYVLRQRGTFSAQAFQSSLALLVAADLLAANLGYNRTCRPDAVYPVTPGIAFLQQHAAEGRIMPLNQTWALYGPPPTVLPPNTGMVYDLHDTQGYDSLLTKRFITWAAALNSGPPAPPENGNMVFTHGYASPEAQDAGARYIVSRAPLPLSPFLRLVYQDNQMGVYENTHALPRLRAAEGTVTEAGNEPPTRITLLIGDAPRGGTLTVAEQWYPGWQERIGKQGWTPLEPSGSLFRILAYPATEGGRTTIAQRYAPDTFRLGLYLLCAALAGLTALAAWEWESRRSGRDGRARGNGGSGRRSRRIRRA